MNQEFNRVPVAEQLEEIEQVDEAINAEYSLEKDGTIARKNETSENPEPKTQ